MSVRGSSGQVVTGKEPLTANGVDRSDARPLRAAVASWEACPTSDRDAFRNRQFLATFTLDLVQWFRAEEARLQEARSPLLVRRRRENHRLARRLRELMAEAGQGLDITSGIRAFLMAWRFHLERVPVPGLTRNSLGH